MSGYLLKPASEDAVARIDWREGYLDQGEYIDADLGWSVVPALGEGDPRIAEQSFEAGASLARVSHGVPGRIYMVSARARTNRGRDLERAIVLRIAA